MFTPSSYKVTDIKLIKSFLNAYPFASLVSIKDKAPIITHLPFVAVEEGQSIRLYSHLANANPHKDVLQTGGWSTAAFLGPHTYISPSLYTRKESAPTWNYMAVHISGATTVYTDEQNKREMLERLIMLTEPAYFAQWEKLPKSYVDALLPLLTAFSIQGEKVEACFKLSQDRPEQDRENVMGFLSSQADTNKKAVAAYMRQLSDNLKH